MPGSKDTSKSRQGYAVTNKPVSKRRASGVIPQEQAATGFITQYLKTRNSELRVAQKNCGQASRFARWSVKRRGQYPHWSSNARDSHKIENRFFGQRR